jgi:hypothetical protein
LEAKPLLILLGDRHAVKAWGMGNRTDSTPVRYEKKSGLQLWLERQTNELGHQPQLSSQARHQNEQSS